MYEAFFHLRNQAFAAAPSPERFFSSAASVSARTTLARIIERGEGPGVIIGPSGTGKTMLCQRLAADFGDRLAVALLTSGRIRTCRALLQAILYELRLPYRGMEEGELRLSLIDHVTPDKGDHPGLLLLVDEAHTLAWRLLEELRMITNLVRGGKPRVRIVLAGGPQLEERLASPKLDSFSQRIAARCYLSAFTREETAQFVRHQIVVSGGEPDRVFAGGAYDAIYNATDGVPRLVNQLCDHVLVLAALAECRPVGAAVVEEAWSDLQQLPSPWQMTSGTAEVSRVVEFAPLDEGAEDAPNAIPFRNPLEAKAPIEAEQNLNQIERRLRELEDDFQPAGSIGPEVELRFSGIVDPFGQTFDDEEIVIDRYASLDADLFSNRPQVNRPDGLELAEMIATWPSPFAEPTLSIAAGPEIELPPSKGAAAASLVVGPIGSSFTMTSATGPAAASIVGDSDRDLIIIEDDPVIPAPAKVAPPLVRRQEYRQLFAKLRHG
ncbi:MAG TPA: AAA family ATPase [Pirellulales bacterium]|nr:AAA family ATPase [Pirellulales bacterium]